MALQNADLFVVERSGTQFKMTADEIADFVGAVRDFTAADITARDALTNLAVGDRVFVTDASSEADVDSGWAIYRLASTGPDVFEKIQEQESMDVTVVANVDLAYTPAPGQGTVTNSAGTNAVIPSVDGTNAGLATPSMFTNNHAAASAALTAGTNPVTVDGSQQVGFDIAQLDALP